MEIRQAHPEDAGLIHNLAEAIWWHTYENIISKDQILFMLHKMYSEEAIKTQLQNGVIFILLHDKHLPIGFAGYELSNSDPKVLRIQKLYLLPEYHGKSLGKLLIRHIESIARELDTTTLELNVNRANPAFHFYKKIGFHIHQEIDIPYFQFELNDYVMRKLVPSEIISKE